MTTPPATVEVCSRSTISRDARNAFLLHARVVVFHGGPGCDETTRPPPDVTPVEPQDTGDCFFPPLGSDETPLAYAHFLILRCDLSTTGSELQQALKFTYESFKGHSERSERSIRYLFETMPPADLEDCMEAADDRWVDQVATLDRFVKSPGLQAADLYTACLKDLLCLTNPTSGMVVAGEYPCDDQEDATASFEAERVIRDFHDQETSLRTIMSAHLDKQATDKVWLVSGLAQAERRVEAQSRVRVLDALRYLPADE